MSATAGSPAFPGTQIGSYTPLSEIDAHHGAPPRRPAHFSEARSDECAERADVKLLLDDVRRDYRVTLDRAGVTPTGEGDRCDCERSTHALASEPGPREQTRQCPHARIFLVLRPSCPWHPSVADQTHVLRARFDRTPPDRLAIRVRDEATGGVGVRMATIGLHPKSVGALVDRKRPERLPGLQLVALALTPRTLTTCPEDRLQVLKVCIVRRNDVQRRSCFGHEPKDATPARPPCNPALASSSRYRGVRTTRIDSPIGSAGGERRSTRQGTYRRLGHRPTGRCERRLVRRRVSVGGRPGRTERDPDPSEYRGDSAPARCPVPPRLGSSPLQNDVARRSVCVERHSKWC